MFAIIEPFKVALIDSHNGFTDFSEVPSFTITCIIAKPNFIVLTISA